jgi:predicted anti-sigma-YlaC factor YlaD
MYMLIGMATIGFSISAGGALMLGKNYMRGVQLIILGHAVMGTAMILKGLI